MNRIDIIGQNGNDGDHYAMLKNEERTKCEVWSRVMGYHRPVMSFNVGKKQEFKDRKPFTESAIKQK
jgi:anaerobic ribonucleoside-triphosphate reductase